MSNKLSILLAEDEENLHEDGGDDPHYQLAGYFVEEDPPSRPARVFYRVSCLRFCAAEALPAHSP